MLKCVQCDKTFEKPESYRKHKYRNHRIRPPAVLFSCYHCKYATKYKFNLGAHMKIHFRIPQQRVSVIPLSVCRLCNSFQCADRGSMIHHYQNTHDIQITERTLNFTSDEEFVTWKREVESTECCRFIRNGGARKRDRHISVEYLRCFRDGHYTPRGTGKRRLKVRGSCKIGSVCPSSMKVIKNSATGAIIVMYVARHVGHHSEPGRMNLTKEEKDSIALKLSAGVPTGSILNSFRESIFNGQVSRIHLTTRQDVWNIRTSLHLRNEFMLHSDDRTSVEAWLATLDNYSDVVRFYKAQSSELPSHPELKEEDFVLILAFESQLEMLQKFGNDCVCLDGTHGTNGYSFELTTLLVKDDNKQGLPCAYMISNRSDLHIMALFIGVIMGLLKDPITPEVLMSDMSAIYFNAWSAVMPNPVRWLFCAWHVDQAWRKNLNKISDLTKRFSTYKLLRIMADEPDENEFSILLVEGMKLLYKDTALLEFAKYFSQEYASRVECWAFCYRKSCGINTNMFLGSMHKVLKHYYLDGKKVKRLDQGLTELLKFTNDKMIDRKIVIARKRDKLTHQLTSIRDMHDSSITLKSRIIPTENGWMISSESKPDLYIVTKLNVICDCTLRCEVCRICEHEYRCTCQDSRKSKICEHIHIIANFTNQTTTTESSPNDREDNGELNVAEDNTEDNFEASILNELLAKNQAVRGTETKFEETKRAVITELSALVESTKNLAQLEVIKKAMLPVPHAIRALEAGLIFTNEGPMRKTLHPYPKMQKDFGRK